jgi:hypothetical protein
MRIVIGLLLLLLLAAPASAQTWECFVFDPGDARAGDGSGYVTLGVAKDGEFVFRNRYLLADLAAVKQTCRVEIVRLQGKESQPIVSGRVDLTVPEPPPPPTPTPEEVTRAAFLADVVKLSRMRTAILLNLKAANDADVVALRDKLRAQIVADPALLDLLVEAQ